VHIAAAPPGTLAYIYYRIERFASCSISIWIDDDVDGLRRAARSPVVALIGHRRSSTALKSAQRRRRRGGGEHAY